jgi:hypothetical protein
MVLFLLLSLVGFCASVVVHASSYLDRAPVPMSRAWPLHVGIFLVFVPMVLAQRQDGGAQRKKSWREQFPHAPRWMVPMLTALAVYTLINFAMGLVLLMISDSPGKFVERDGRYVVANRGVVVRPATEAEYRRDQARTARRFSGHWMLFYWASAVGIADGLRRRKAERLIAAAPQAPRPAGARYMLRPSPRLTLWTHATLIALVRIVCAFGFFLAVAISTVSINNRPGPGIHKSFGCVGFLLVLPAALFGAVVPARWLARRLPARCPYCNGRAYCDGANAGRGTFDYPYTCRDCGRSFRPDGSIA